jgi:hypothetical protein
MSASFDPLWERLLAGGVRPRRARRYVAELRDHLNDLVAEERQATSNPRDAEMRALSRLGSFEMLADAMIERREFRAWGRRAPIATYLVAPAVVLAATTALAVAGVVLTVQSVRGSAGAANGLPAWLQVLAHSVAFATHAILPTVLAWALGAMAIRQRSPILWPLCGIVALVVLGGLIQVDLTLPSPTTRGEVALAGPSGSLSAQLIAFGGQLALALAPYVGLLLWRGAREREAV